MMDNSAVQSSTWTNPFTTSFCYHKRISSIVSWIVVILVNRQLTGLIEISVGVTTHSSNDAIWSQTPQQCFIQQNTFSDNC